MILGGGVLTPISFISLLMIIAGSPGTKPFDPGGFFLVVLAPALTAFAGIGVVKRWRWAWFYVVVAAAIAAGWNLWDAMKPVPDSPTVTFSPSGVKTTVYHSRPVFAMPVAAFCGGVVAFFLAQGVRREFGVVAKEPSAVSSSPPPLPNAAVANEVPMASPAPHDRQWRVGHRGRDMMYYEEWRDRAWQRIDIDGEMLTGRAHHVIYFPTETSWQRLPEWARHRRAEIIGRIKSEFREPDYEYQEFSGGCGASTILSGPSKPAPASPVRETRRHLPAVVASVAFLLAIAGWMGWLVKRGIETGEVPFLAARGVPHRTVVRQQEPVMFWTCVGLYGAIGTGSVGLIAWGFSVAAKDSRSRERQMPGR